MLLALLGLLLLLAVAVFWAGLAHRQIHTWFWAYVRHQRRVGALPPVTGPTHVMFCFVDHYEPLAAGADDELGMRRVDRWATEYRKVAGAFRDADGCHPIHSFFYPEEEYRPQYLDVVGALCRDGFGEVEIHLHHDHDTPAGLTDKLSRFTTTLKSRHGLLPTLNGGTPFAFIHGNWALDNSRGDGRWCGIDNELIVLREAGCYADFTLPSAPSDTQTRTINAIYYAEDDPHRPKSHDAGIEMKVGGQPSGDLLIFQGPLALHWRHRKFGIWPRIENSDISPTDIPIADRIPVWLEQHIHVAGRPEWLFIKVHTHGAIEENADFLFDGELRKLFEGLQQQCNDGKKYQLHYVSAREAYNIAKAAEAGKSGNPNDYRDFVIPRAF
ncbi:MAG: hypothetical protein JNN20_12845 [Betaproteobacteria bacterium]|nr:hypothetical protein [Betaproteobacteria bacterium]